MKILWHISDPHAPYAGRYIAEGYGDAFADLGHEFHLLRRGDNFRRTYEAVRPDLFFTFVDDEYYDALDLDFLTRERAAGRVRVFAFVHPVRPIAPALPGMGGSRRKILAIREGRYADHYHSYFEEWLMRDFETLTGQRYRKIPLAANRLKHFAVAPEPAYECDIVFIGAYLLEKRAIFDQLLLPLTKRYRVRIVGRDWRVWDRTLGWIEGRARWHLGLPVHLRGELVNYAGERALYSSARIAVNFHLDFQAALGADVNERTFRIPACGGFELCDWNRAVRAYFGPTEVVVAEDPDDWLSKVEHFLGADAEREQIRRAGTARVLAAHTYHHRVAQILEIADEESPLRVVKEEQGDP